MNVNNKFSHVSYYDYDISQHSNFLACLILQKLQKEAKYSPSHARMAFFLPSKNSHDALRTYTMPYNLVWEDFTHFLGEKSSQKILAHSNDPLLKTPSYIL